MNYSVKVALTCEEKPKIVKPEELSELNPKQLVLYSGAMCAAYTIQHLLKREHLKLKSLEITLSGELSTATLLPESEFESFMVNYNAECNTLEEQSKVSQIIRITQDRACGLIRMLKKIAPVSHEISIVSTESL